MPPPTHVGGQGSALILLHGLGGTWEIWKPVLRTLEARHRVIAMTLPGHHGGPAYAGSGDATVRRDGPVAALEVGSIPIRIAWCERDRVIPFGRYGELLVERIHGANVRVVRGVGHVPIYDDPEQVVANILAVTGPIDAERQIAN